MIQVIDYQKAYDTTIAVESLSFEVQPGSILGLVGPNGAGKTTTMRAIAGIIQPNAASCWLRDACLGVWAVSKAFERFDVSKQI